MMMTDLRIAAADLDDPRILALLVAHVTRAVSEAAQGGAYALDQSGLRAPGITLWAIWDGEQAIGLGALKRLEPDHGEVKSMFTAEAARGRGAGRLMLRHIIAVARSERLSRLSLETGTRAYFDPAHALYRSEGFSDCAPFGDYRPDPNSLFLMRSL